MFYILISLDLMFLFICLFIVLCLYSFIWFPFFYLFPTTRFLCNCIYIYLFFYFFYSSICCHFILHLSATDFGVSFGLSVFCRSVLDFAACSLPSLSSVAFFFVLGSREKRIDAVRDGFLTFACAFGSLFLSGSCRAAFSFASIPCCYVSVLYSDCCGLFSLVFCCRYLVLPYSCCILESVCLVSAGGVGYYGMVASSALGTANWKGDISHRSFLGISLHRSCSFFFWFFILIY